MSSGGGGGAAPDDSEDEEDEEDDREPFASLSMEEHRGGPADALPPPYDHTMSFSFTGPGSRRMRHSQSASSGLDSGSAPDTQGVDAKMPLSRTTDGGFHLTMSTTAPARTTGPDPTLAFTSPKSMETQDDLSRPLGTPRGEL